MHGVELLQLVALIVQIVQNTNVQSRTVQVLSSFMCLFVILKIHKKNNPDQLSTSFISLIITVSR